LLFWSWLLSAYGFVTGECAAKADQELIAIASMVLAENTDFLSALVNFVANPFGIMDRLAPDGNGLNPLLQYPEMVIHPPMLLPGLCRLFGAIAFALASLDHALSGGKVAAYHRRWTMVTWLFLTCGIFLGAHWAYAVLGWGGYWGCGTRGRMLLCCRG